MGSADYLKVGDWNVTCDRCGFKKKASDCQFDHGRRGQGNTLYVCKRCVDEPQMQDYVKGVTDRQAAPIVRNPGQPKFTTTPVDPYEF